MKDLLKFSFKVNPYNVTPMTISSMQFVGLCPDFVQEIVLVSSIISLDVYLQNGCRLRYVVGYKAKKKRSKGR